MLRPVCGRWNGLNSDQVESPEEYKRQDLVLALQPYLSKSSITLDIAKHKHTAPGSPPLEAKNKRTITLDPLSLSLPRSTQDT